MAKYTLRRFVWIIPVLLVVAGVTFLMMHAAPGGPWDRDPDRRQVDAATQKMLNTRFNLDQPLGQQFISYMFVDVDEGKTPEIGKLDLGIFGTHQIGPKDGATVTLRRLVHEPGTVLSAARPRRGKHPPGSTASGQRLYG